MSIANWGGTKLQFGDFTGGADSNWQIDYIRWTGQGAFDPGACGDSTHPILPGDLNQNCVVDFKDLSIFVSNWLQPPISTPGITADSTTWEGRYEGDQYPDMIVPDANSWLAEGQIVDFSFLPGGGILNLDSYNLDKIGFFTKTIPSSFEQGFSLEIKAKINEVESYPGARSAAASLICYDKNKNYFLLRFDDDQVSLGNLGNIAVNPKGAFHTYRIAALDGTNMLKVWVDSDTAPALTATIYEVGALANTINFGDLTVTNDADWDIDYLRWTSHGAFAPVGAASYCGDGNHQFRPGDIDYDCSVNLKDFAMMAAEWLKNDQPQ
jgi:hypothetical protein